MGQFSIHISSSFNVEGTLADFIIISGLRYMLERGGMPEPHSMFMNYGSNQRFGVSTNIAECRDPETWPDDEPAGEVVYHGSGAFANTIVLRVTDL